MVLKIVRTVWPVMLTYVAIGAPCGMIMGQTGMEPWMVFALSSTFVTGSGQFMICNLWLAGVPVPSIIASVAAISSRFALYSASIAPHLAGASKRQTLAVAATLTEEAYGISLAKLVEGGGLGPARILRAQRDPHRDMGRFVHDGCHRRCRCRCSHRYCEFRLHVALYLSTLFAAAVARQRCRGGFGRGVRRRMQVLGPHEYCRAGKRRGRHCHCAGVRCRI